MEDHLANSIAALKAKFSGFWKQASADCFERKTVRCAVIKKDRRGTVSPSGLFWYA